MARLGRGAPGSGRLGAADTGRRAIEKEREGRRKTGVFPVPKAGTQFSFPLDIDVSTLGHPLGRAWILNILLRDLEFF